MARILLPDGKGGTKIGYIGEGYSGPVPEGYSEKTFRDTGRTILAGSRSGGGGSSGGGSGGSGTQPTGGMTTTTGTSVLVTPSGKKVGSASPKKTITQSELRSKAETLSRDYASKIRVGAGPVETERRKYYGKAIVPKTGGKTATQLKQETFLEAKKEGYTKKGSYKAVYSSNYFVGETPKEEIKTTTSTSNALTSSNPFQSGGVYNPKTGMFETTPSAYGQAGQETRNVVSSRFPTEREQMKIDQPATLFKQDFRTTFGIPQEGLIKSDPTLKKIDETIGGIFPAGNKTLPYGTGTMTTEQAQKKFNPFYAGDYFGKKVSDSLSNKTRESINQYFNQKPIAKAGLTLGYEATRELPKFAFFSPAMVTGTSAKAEVVTEEETISEALSKSKIGEALSKLKKDLVKKKAGKEQTEYLSGLYKNLKTTQEKENFRKWVVGLYEEGTFKGIDIKYYQGQPLTATKTESGIYVMSRNLPKMERVDVLGSGTSALGQPNKNDIFVTPQKSMIDLGQGKIQTDSLGLGQGKIQFQPTKQRQGSGLLFKTETQQKTIPKQKEELKQKERIKQKETTALKYLTALRTQQKQIQKQKQRQIQKKVSRSSFRPKPQRPIPKIPVLSGSLLKSLSKKAESGELFRVYGKRFGQDFLLGTSESKKGAKEKLSKFLTGTLGRSGQVFKGEKALSFGELGFNEMFRPSKRDKGRVVQKRKYSLGTSGERKEIQYFKRKSGSKSKKKKTKLDWFT